MQELPAVLQPDIGENPQQKLLLHQNKKLVSSKVAKAALTPQIGITTSRIVHTQVDCPRDVE